MEGIWMEKEKKWKRMKEFENVCICKVSSAYLDFLEGVALISMR